MAGLVSLFASGGRMRATATDWTVYLRRAGPITIGMSIDGVRRSLANIHRCDAAAAKGTSVEQIPRLRTISASRQSVE